MATFGHAAAKISGIRMNGYALWSILLLIFGLATLVAEIFIPSGGVLAVITVTAIVSSLVLSAIAWLWVAPIWFAAHFAMVLLLVPLCLLGALEILPRTRAGKRMILQPPDGENLRGPQTSTDHDLRQLIGKQGVVRTTLAPGGYVSIGDARYSAVSEDSLLDFGTRIVVAGLRGSTLVVRLPEAGELSTAAEVPMSPAATSRSESADPAMNHGSADTAVMSSSTTSAALPSAGNPHGGNPPAPAVELDPFSEFAAEDSTADSAKRIS
jgi:membrane-bound serine protease (ClpP class)